MDHGTAYASDTERARAPQLARRGSMSFAPPAFLGWAAAATAAPPHSGALPGALPGTLYQLVPVDGTCVGYQPVYAQAHPQQQQPAAFFTYPAAMAMAPLPPLSQAGPAFMAPASPGRRHTSGGYYQQAPQQARPAYEYAAPPYQHAQLYSQQVPARPEPHQQPQQPPRPFQAQASMSAGFDQLSLSPETVRPPVSSTPQYASAVAFATPPPARQADRGMAFDRPPVPATMPRLASRRSAGLLRPHRPLPLSLVSSAFWHDTDWAAPLPVHETAAVPSTAPAGSDREYDGGGSSYSTSPLGSEPFGNRTSHAYVFGMASETSEGTDARGSSRLAMPMSRTMPAPSSRIPRNARAATARVPEAPPSPTPLGGSFRGASRGHGRRPALQSFLRERLTENRRLMVSGEGDGDDDDDGKAPSCAVQFSSSDEWYTTTDTNPIRSRHRHRVAADESADAGGPGLCNCGMQQCTRCGLFISRPETHACVNGLSS